MIENDLGKVLNYMKQYVENVYEHDSEPMLNWKDLKLVLEEIERLHSIIKEVREYAKEMQVYCIEFENWGVPSKELLEIVDKEKE